MPRKKKVAKKQAAKASLISQRQNVNVKINLDAKSAGKRKKRAGKGGGGAAQIRGSDVFRGSAGSNLSVVNNPPAFIQSNPDFGLARKLDDLTNRMMMLYNEREAKTERDITAPIKVETPIRPPVPVTSPQYGDSAYMGETQPAAASGSDSPFTPPPAQFDPFMGDTQAMSTTNTGVTTPSPLSLGTRAAPAAGQMEVKPTPVRARYTVESPPSISNQPPPGLFTGPRVSIDGTIPLAREIFKTGSDGAGPSTQGAPRRIIKAPRKNNDDIVDQLLTLQDGATQTNSPADSGAYYPMTRNLPSGEEAMNPERLLDKYSTEDIEAVYKLNVKREKQYEFRKKLQDVLIDRTLMPAEFRDKPPANIKQLIDAIRGTAKFNRPVKAPKANTGQQTFIDKPKAAKAGKRKLKQTLLAPQ